MNQTKPTETKLAADTYALVRTIEDIDLYRDLITTLRKSTEDILEKGLHFLTDSDLNHIANNHYMANLLNDEITKTINLATDMAFQLKVTGGEKQ